MYISFSSLGQLPTTIENFWDTLQAIWLYGHALNSIFVHDSSCQTYGFLNLTVLMHLKRFGYYITTCVLY